MRRDARARNFLHEIHFLTRVHFTIRVRSLFSRLVVGKTFARHASCHVHEKDISVCFFFLFLSGKNYSSDSDDMCARCLARAMSSSRPNFRAFVFLFFLPFLTLARETARDRIFTRPRLQSSHVR